MKEPVYLIKEARRVNTTGAYICLNCSFYVMCTYVSINCTDLLPHNYVPVRIVQVD